MGEESGSGQVRIYTHRARGGNGDAQSSSRTAEAYSFDFRRGNVLPRSFRGRTRRPECPPRADWRYGAEHAAQGIAVLKSHDIAPINRGPRWLCCQLFRARSPPTIWAAAPVTRGALSSRIMAAPPRLILAIGPLAAQVARAEVQGIPVVFAARPQPAQVWSGGRQYHRHLPGCAHREHSLPCTKSLLPTLRVLGVIYDPEKTGALVKEAERGGGKIRAALPRYPSGLANRGAKQPCAACWARLMRSGCSLTIPSVTPESLTFFLLTAFKQNLPVLTISDAFVEAGALAALSPDYTDVGRQACQLSKEIESGRRPRRRPVLSRRTRSTSLLTCRRQASSG